MTPESFHTTILKATKPVIVDFAAPWCQPCKALSKILAKIEEEIGEKAIVIRIDVDIYPQIADAYNIKSLPTLLFFKSGTVAGSLAGLTTREKIVDSLRRVGVTFDLKKGK
jgi:thioredoxin 1